MFRPSHLKAFLESIGASPKKGLSQNFLIDGNIITKLVDEAHLTNEDHVLEIGPGPGAITEALLQKGCSVTAVEKDHRFAKALERLDVKVVEGDILTFPLETLPKGSHVVANLPYALTAPILAQLAPSPSLDSLTLMVQDEVAKRMVAKAGSKNYSSLSIFLAYYAEVRYAFFVSRNCFYPKPKVDSAVVSIKLKKRALLKDPAPFFRFVRTAFSQRRKQLTSSLRGFDHIGEVLKERGLSQNARPEELSLEHFLALYTSLGETSSP